MSGALACLALSASPARAADCKDAITGLLTEHLGVVASKVVPRADLVKDLGADDLDHVELVMAMMATFDMEVTDADAKTLKTVGDVIAYANRNAKTGCR